MIPQDVVQAFQVLEIDPQVFCNYMRPELSIPEAAQALEKFKAEILKPAWRKTIQRYHPDKPDTGDKDKFQQAQDAYARINLIQVGRKQEPPPWAVFGGFGIVIRVSPDGSHYSGVHSTTSSTYFYS